MSETYIKTAINRLNRSGKIISPAKGFYVIVPAAITIVIEFRNLISLLLLYPPI
jgi:DNA-binding transcriptional regulator PaaX